MATARLLVGSPMVLRAGWSKGLGPVRGLCRDLRQRFAVTPLPTGAKGDDFRHRLDAIIDPGPRAARIEALAAMTSRLIAS